MDSGAVLRGPRTISQSFRIYAEEDPTRMSSNPGRDSGKSTMIGNSSLTLKYATQLRISWTGVGEQRPSIHLCSKSADCNAYSIRASMLVFRW